MNNFKIRIGGSSVTAVFPLTYAELLDERLDEAQITFFSRTKFYKPTTLVEIEITTGDITEIERYVVISLKMANMAQKMFKRGSNGGQSFFKPFIFVEHLPQHLL